MPPEKTRILKFEFKPDKILGRAVTLHGATKTGKSRVTRNLCYNLKDYISSVFLFCSVYKKNNDFDGIIPDVVKSEHLSAEALLGIIERQKSLSESVKLAEKYSEEFWPVIADPKIEADYQNAINRIAEIRERVGSMITPEQEESLAREAFDAAFIRDKKIREVINKKIKKLYRHFGLEINTKYPDPQYMRLKCFEQCFRLNYNCLIIIDDCTDEIAGVPTEVWQQLYNRSRHFGITIIMTVHNLQCLKHPTLKTAPYAHVFTEPSSATYFLNNGTAGAKGLVRPATNELAASFMNNSNGGRRLIFEKEGNDIKTHLGSFEFQWDLPEFRLGDPVLWKLDEHIKRKAGKRPEKIPQSLINN